MEESGQMRGSGVRWGCALLVVAFLAAIVLIIRIGAKSDPKARLPPTPVLNGPTLPPSLPHKS